MNNDDKFKVSIQSMLDYELPDIAIKFEDCKTEYIFTGIYDGNRAISAKLLKLIENDKTFAEGADK